MKGLGELMMLDKNSVELLLRLGDDQLISVIKKLAASAGVDVSTLEITPTQLVGIRQALSIATDEDLRHASELLQNFKNSQGLS